MNGVLPLVALVALATAITFLLDRGGRTGYGWVTGSEFVLAGVLLGPVGLDLLSSDILEASRSLIALGAAWLGLRLGLRLRPANLRAIRGRLLVASQIEPLVALLTLRGLLELGSRFGGMPLSSATSWAIASVGAATTKSAAAWARAKLGAQGAVIDALEAVTALDDLVCVAGVAVVLAALRPMATRLPPELWAPLVTTLALGLGMGLLIALLTGRGTFRPDLAWVAMLGACALGTGLADALGLSPVAVTCAAGICASLVSPHADRFEALTRSTERPTVQVLLLLGGAAVGGGLQILLLGATVAGLRLVAKVVCGAVVTPALPREARRPELGLGLLGAGGVAFAVSLSLAPKLPPGGGEALCASAVMMALLGDFLGSPLLRVLLARAGELPVTTRPAEAP